MKKTVNTATDLKKKSYAKPGMKIVEIEQAELICQSGGATTQLLEEEEWNNW